MILDGKKIATEILKELKTQIEAHALLRPPTLAYLLIGDNPASHLYVKYKVKACEQLGIQTKAHHLPKDISEPQVLRLLDTLNQASDIDGVLVQMPLPAQLSTQKIIEAIDPQKDVDGFHPLNMGRLLLGYEPHFIPCTPLGIHEMLKYLQIPIGGKHVVILGRSNIVGKPLAALLAQKSKEANATVTLAHSYTQNVEEITLSADILVAAMGQPEKVTGSMVKQGAIVIDVGINRLKDKLVGDVLFEDVVHKASYITPVPKGVGPMTIAMLLSNTFKSFCKRESLA